MSTVTTVSSVALHLVEVDHGQVEKAMITSIATQENFNSIYIRDIITGIGNKMKGVFDYAKNEYTLALPSGVATDIQLPSLDTIANALTDDIGYSYDVVVLRFKYIPYKPYMEVLDFLLSDRAFDLYNEIAYSYPTIVFTGDMQLRVTDSSISLDGLSVDMSYELWGTVFTTTPGDAESGSVEVTTGVWALLGTYSESILRPSVVNTEYGDNTLIAWYRKYDVGGALLPNTDVWIYRVSEDRYSEVDPNRSVSAVGEYLPVVPLRYNNQDLTGQDEVIYQTSVDTLTPQVAAAKIAYDDAYAIDGGVGSPAPSDALYAAWQSLLSQLNAAEASLASAIAIKTTPLYLTSKELLKKLNLPIESLGDSINSNPDLPEIDHAYVMFGVDLQSNESASMAYLNHYFNYIGTLNVDRFDATAVLNYTSNGEPIYVDSVFTEYGLSLSMTYDSIQTSYITGSVGNGNMGNAEKSIEYTLHEAVPGTDEFDLGTPAYISTVLTIDLQTTPVTIRRVVINNLVVTNHIDGGYVVTATPQTVKDDPDNHNLIIPIDYNLSLVLGTRQRNELYTDCALLVINAVVKTKLKWYQEQWFSAIVFIVGVVVTVVGLYYGGIDLAYWWGQGLYAFLAWLAINIVISLAIKIVFDWIVEKVGAKIGIIGALVLTVIGLILTQGRSGAGLLGQYTMMTGQIALQMSVALLSSVNEFIQLAAQKVIEEYDAFTKLMGDAYDAINTNSEVEAMNNKPDFDPLNYVYPKRYYTVPAESPDAFFRRTLGLYDNTYYVTHNAISNFAANLLTLDKSFGLPA